jgi:hypothetical protein
VYDRILGPVAAILLTSPSSTSNVNSDDRLQIFHGFVGTIAACFYQKLIILELLLACAIHTILKLFTGDEEIEQTISTE